MERWQIDKMKTFVKISRCGIVTCTILMKNPFFPFFAWKMCILLTKKKVLFIFFFFFLFQKRKKKKKTKSDIENNLILAKFVLVLASTLKVLTLLLDSSQLVMWLNFFCAKILFILSIICHHIRRCED